MDISLRVHTESDDLKDLVEPIRRTAMALSLSGILTLVKEFTDGKTATRVVLARLKNLGSLQPFHYVFKVGSNSQLLEEVENYLTLRSSVGNDPAFNIPFVPLQDPEKTRALLSSGEGNGALAYHHAAAPYGAPQDISLKGLFRDCLQGKRPTKDCTDALTLLVGAIVTNLYKEPERAFGCAVSSYYLAKWFPDYRVQVTGSFSESDKVFLTHDKPDFAQLLQQAAQYSSPQKLRQESELPRAHTNLIFKWHPSAPIRLKGHTLVITSPDDDLHLHIDVSQASQNIQQLVTQANELCIWSTQVRSRYELYRERLEKAFPGFNPDADSFSLGQVDITLPNPLRLLSQVFSSLANDETLTHVTPAHGDLHPGNVLLVGVAPHIIDYGLSRRNLPLGVDLIRLLGCLIRDVASEILTPDELEVVLWEVFSANSGRILSAEGQRARDILSRLWEMLREKLKADAAILPFHLYGFAWIGLEWAGTQQAHRSCFLLAAIASGMISGKIRRTLPRLKESAEAPRDQTPVSQGVVIVHPYALQEHFTGRKAERIFLNNWWKEGRKPILGLIAMGGMGKSALAWVWLHADLLGNNLPGSPPALEPQSHMPDGVFWWSFYEPGASFTAFLTSAAAFVSPNRKIESQAEMVDELLNTLKRQRLLLIMDGLERELLASTWRDSAHQEALKDEDQSQNVHRSIRDPRLADFLIRVAALPLSGRILFTSRDNPRELDDLAGVERYNLKDLSQEDALEFFHSKGIPWISSELSAVGEFCGYHPLSLRLLAGYILKGGMGGGALPFNPKVLVEILRDAKRREHHILMLAYNDLPSLSQLLLSRLAAFRNRIRIESVAVLSPFEREDSRALGDALADLVDRGMLSFEQQSLSYDMHPVVRSYSYERLANSQEVHQKLANYLKHYTPETPIQSIEDAEVVIELYYQTVSSGARGEALTLYGQRLHEILLDSLNQPTIALRLLQMLLNGGRVHSSWDSEEDHLNAVVMLAHVYIECGHFKQGDSLISSWVTAQLEPSHRLRVLKVVGDAKDSMGDYMEAERAFLEALDIARTLSDDLEAARFHRSLSLVYAGIEQLGEAVSHLESAKSFFEKSFWQEPSDRILLLLHSVAVARAGREYEKASRLAQESLRIATLESLERSIFFSEFWLGAIMLEESIGGYFLEAPQETARSDTAGLDGAEQMLRRALARARRADDLASVHNINLYLAACQLARGDWMAAKSLLEPLFKIFQARGDKSRYAGSSLLLAHVANCSQNFDEAKKYAVETRRLALSQNPRYRYRRVLKIAERLLESLP